MRYSKIYDYSPIQYGTLDKRLLNISQKEMDLNAFLSAKQALFQKQTN